MLEGSVILITGTSRGIGRHLAQHYLARGVQVVGCSRNRGDIEHPRFSECLSDVADEEGIRGVMRHVVQQHGRLDALLNNAGIASMNHCLTTPMQSVRDVLRTNVEGTFLLCREAAKLMQRRRFGRIVNFATVATPLRLEGEAIYAASKAAVVTLTQVLARELGAFSITVNAVGPTPVKTDLLRGIPKAKLESLLARQALARFGEFADVANVVDFFVSSRSDFVTGQTVYLGGVS